MSDFQIRCDSESRKKSLQDLETVNGIDYIEVIRVEAPEVQNNNSDSDTDGGLDVSSSDKTGSTSSSILLLLFLIKEPTTPNTIEKANLIILGGTRIRNIGIQIAGRPDEILGNLNENEKEIINGLNSSKRKKLIVIKPTQEGDFSVYTLRLVEKEKPEETLSNFDPLFSQIDFSFKIDCNLDFDCKVDRICPPVIFEEPLLDYMAKDYASFVKLILSRFSHIIPEWKEKSAADLTNVLIEILSYVGDHLSYYQDSVSTEAYLGTARKRISIKRHARLLDYFVYEGSNARTWVCLEVDPTKATKDDQVKGLILKKSTKVLTGEPKRDIENPLKISISEDDFKEELVSQSDMLVFETMHDINLYTFHNEMYFYTWGETDCCLPKGSTHATLLSEIKENNNNRIDSLDIRIFSWETIVNNKSDQNNLKKFLMRISSIFHDQDSINIIKKDNNKTLIMVDNENPSKFIAIKLFRKEERALATDNDDNLIYEFMAKKKLGNKTQIYGLSLNKGDVLIFEEILSPTTLNSADRDPLHRQAVKLRDVKRKIDPINKANLVEIYWDEQDSLRFPLCINKISSSHVITNNENEESNDNIKIISVARGNVVLVDHGYTIKNEELEDVPTSGIFYPKLDKIPITFASPFISSASAYSSIYCKQQVGDDDIQYPEIIVTEGLTRIVMNSNDDNDEDEEKENEVDGVGIIRWYPSRDLLSSDKFAKEFVVEIDNGGTAYLRFGDGKNGQKPESILDSSDNNNNNNDPVKFFASYRIGNGRIGNVGSETIKRIVENIDNKHIVEKIKKICNPLPAIGGTDQESLNEVIQNAPVAFMKQERAVTEGDYAYILGKHKEVQRAMVMFRWTGSWYTVYVTIDRIGGKIVDESFKQEIYSFLNKYRLAGYDLEINSPNFVPLDIEINVCVKPNNYPEKIKKILLNIFSTRVLENGQIGFFHPDNFTFGQPLYLSKIYQTIMNVEGVESVFVNRFQRMGKKSMNMELEKGVIEIHSSEIIRLDNDPNFPDNGKIEFVMRGGI